MLFPRTTSGPLCRRNHSSRGGSAQAGQVQSSGLRVGRESVASGGGKCSRSVNAYGVGPNSRRCSPRPRPRPSWACARPVSTTARLSPDPGPPRSPPAARCPAARASARYSPEPVGSPRRHRASPGPVGNARPGHTNRDHSAGHRAARTLLTNACQASRETTSQVHRLSAAHGSSQRG
jgi:hypothetical protein